MLLKGIKNIIHWENVVLANLVVRSEKLNKLKKGREQNIFD